MEPRRSRSATRAGDAILVTGATGRIGANLCRTLLARGYRVRAVVLPGDPGLAKLAGLDLEIVVADLRGAAAVASACADVDAICHLAALIGGPDTVGMAVTDYWHANVDATLHVLEGARRNGRLVKLVFASSDATYPTSNPRYSPVDESHPQDPVNLYGLTKVVGERMCRDYATEFALPVTVVRYGGVSTPDERASVGGASPSAHATRLREAKRSHDNYLWANVRDHERPWEYLEPLAEDDDRLIALTDQEGRPWQTHSTDVRDAVQGTVLALECAAAVGEAFNIHGPAPVSSVELVRYLAERFSLPWRTAAVPFRQAVEVSTAKARAILGYRPAYDIFRTIDDGLAMQAGVEIGVVPAKLPIVRSPG
jgi:nucleoside-diphosphate-sugar epimerase